MSLRVNGTGHVVHAFVNGKYVGSKWGGYDSTGIDNLYETNVTLKQGKNQISLLSATVGLTVHNTIFYFFFKKVILNIMNLSLQRQNACCYTKRNHRTELRSSV